MKIEKVVQNADCLQEKDLLSLYGGLEREGDVNSNNAKRCQCHGGGVNINNQEDCSCGSATGIGHQEPAEPTRPSK